MLWFEKANGKDKRQQRQAKCTRKENKVAAKSKLSFFIKKHQDEEAIKDINEDNDSNMSANSKETKENEQSTFANEDDSNSTRSLIETCNTSSSTIGYPSGASADSQKLNLLITVFLQNLVQIFKILNWVEGLKEEAMSVVMPVTISKPHSRHFASQREFQLFVQFHEKRFLMNILEAKCMQKLLKQNRHHV